ncbi:phage baseplate plug family protein, partial [Escherichia coli]
MAAYEIPLTAEAQRFAIQLAGKVYQMTLQWRNNAQGGWVL